MDKIVSLVTLGFGVTQESTGAESATDRLSSKYTVGVLALLAVYLAISGSPLQCFVDPQVQWFNKDYMNAQCWSKNTYIEVPTDSDDGPRVEKVHLTFYPWLSLLLILQAIMFLIPSAVWHVLCKLSGVCSVTVIESAVQFYRSKNSADAEKIFYNFTNRLYRYLENRRQNDFQDPLLPALHAVSHKKDRLRNPSYRGSHYLPIVYIFTQLFYVLNAVLQLAILDIFLSVDPDKEDFISHVFLVIISVVGVKGREHLKYFPTTSLCDLEVRNGTVEGFAVTVQCTIDKDWFYESIFIILVFMYVILVLAHCVSFVWWLWTLYIKYSETSTYTWVGKHLRDMNYSFSNTYASSMLKEKIGDDWPKIKDKLRDHLDPGDGARECTPEEEKAFRENLLGFVRRFLRKDGIFAYRMILSNTSELVAAQMLYQLWVSYKLSRNKHPITKEKPMYDNYITHDRIRRMKEAEDPDAVNERDEDEVRLEKRQMLDIKFFTEELKLAQRKNAGYREKLDVILRKV